MHSFKRIFFLSTSLMFLLPFISNAQSKKEQIVELQQRVDSLNAVLANVQSQLKTTEEQLKDRVEYGKDVDLRLSQCKSTLSSTQDTLQDSVRLNAELNKTIVLKNSEIEEKKLKLEQSQKELSLVKDSLAMTQTKILELNNQLKSLQAERENLKLELAKQEASKSQKNSEDKASLIAELEKVAPLKDYKVNSKAQIEELTFSAFEMGDVGHTIFKNSQNEEHDFGGNLTEIKLFLETDQNIDENMGYISNSKYVGKKFIVGWRNVKLTHKPTDYIEEYYQQYDEIVYLKQLN